MSVNGEDAVMSDGGDKGKKKPPDPDKTKEKTSKTDPILFEPTDEGPYVVFVESTSGRNGIDRLHPMAVGNIFKRLHPEIQNKMEVVLKNGKNIIKIAMKSYESANTLVSSQKMTDKGFQCYIPKFLVTKQALIRGVYKELTEDEIRDETEIPYALRHKVKLISVRRFNRKENDSWVPTETVQLTFRAQVLPEYVTIHYVRCKVEAFIPKVLQCAT